MTISEEEAKRRRQLNLSWHEVKANNPNWSDIQVQDYLEKQQETDDINLTIADLEKVVNSNTQGIEDAAQAGQLANAKNKRQDVRIGDLEALSNEIDQVRGLLAQQKKEINRLNSLLSETDSGAAIRSLQVQIDKLRSLIHGD